MGGYVILGFLIGVLFSLFGLLRYELDYVEKRIDDIEAILSHGLSNIEVTNMNYDIALKEKIGTKGLTKAEVTCMFELLPDFAEVYPVEFYNTGCEISYAMGLITAEAAEKLDYKTDKNSPIAEYIGNILADTSLESETGEYKFMGLKIYLTR